MTDGSVLRRKAGGAARAAAAGPDGAARAFRLALARAARDEVGLDLEVTRLAEARMSLAELLEQPPDRAFLAMLEGPEGGLGTMALSPEVMAALIEVQTTGRLTGAPPPPRRPTRTDAAMVAGTLDRALRDMEAGLAESPDLAWAGGFHYASFLDDARPLGLLLDDQPYRVMTATVVLGDAGRQGRVLLALPAEGRGPKPVAKKPAAPDPAQAARAWSQALSAAVAQSEVTLHAVIGRIRLPLAQVSAFRVGAVLPIGQASIDTVALEAAGGRKVAEARLGQNRGLRALRLNRIEDAGAAARAPVPVAPHPAAAGAPPDATARPPDAPMARSA